VGHRRGLAAFALLSLLAGTIAWGQQTPPPVDTNDALFRHALALMNALPLPPSFTYTAQIQTDGGTVGVQRAGADNIDAMFVAGGKTGAEGTANSTYTFSFDNRKRVTYLVGGANILGRLPGPVFDPTWNSAFRWMQSRRFFYESVGSEAPSPQPTATRLKTIAIVSRSPELSYHVVRSTRATCENQDSGWELNVVPVGDPENYPLTGVLVDDRTGLLCAMQFEESMGSVAGANARGTIELRFNRIDGLYVVTAESIAMHLALPGSVHAMTANISFGQFAEQ
jgi:hypothetical protein